MDCFALLDEPRRPWLEVAALKEKFLARGAECHPDKFTDPAGKETAQARFTGLNTAHETLRDPKRRLAHLLTLERGEKPPEVHDIPPGTEDLFLEVGALLKGVDEFLKEHEQRSSPILKAQALPRALEHLDQVHSLQQMLAGKLDALNTELKALNETWETDKPLAGAERLYHQFSYLTRWQQQLQDRGIRLGLR